MPKSATEKQQSQAEKQLRYRKRKKTHKTIQTVTCELWYGEFAGRCSDFTRHCVYRCHCIIIATRCCCPVIRDYRTCIDFN